MTTIIPEYHFFPVIKDEHNFSPENRLLTSCHGIIPVENARQLGLLLCENISDGVATNVQHVRSESLDHKRVYQSLLFGKRYGAYLIETPEHFVLPLPSKEKYGICELTNAEYTALEKQFTANDNTVQKEGIEEAIDIISKRTNFSTKMRGFPGFRSLRLVTPKGYADREELWYSFLEDELTNYQTFIASQKHEVNRR